MPAHPALSCNLAWTVYLQKPTKPFTYLTLQSCVVSFGLYAVSPKKHSHRAFGAGGASSRQTHDVSTCVRAVFATALSPRPGTKTFIDCDDLNDLTRLFSYVGQESCRVARNAATGRAPCGGGKAGGFPRRRGGDDECVDLGMVI